MKMSNVKRYNNVPSDLFVCKNGLIQGEALLPILFALCVNDCKIHLLTDNCPYIEMKCLIYY